MMARCLQHEPGHLDGRTMTDYLEPVTRARKLHEMRMVAGTDI